MGYNQRKKSKKLKEQWKSVQIQQGAIVKPGIGNRRGNNKPKILTRRMKKLLTEIQQEDSELLELQEQMLEKTPATKSKKSKTDQASTEHVDEPADVETEECPMDVI